jgi:hypothetical protein
MVGPKFAYLACSLHVLTSFAALTEVLNAFWSLESRNPSVVLWNRNLLSQFKFRLLFRIQTIFCTVFQNKLDKILPFFNVRSSIIS